MRTRTLLLGGALALLLAAPAEAKEIKAVKVCGPDGCRQTTRQEQDGLMVLVREGTPVAPPQHGSEWYRVRVRIGGGGHTESFGLVASPAAGLTRWSDSGVGRWVQMTGRQADAYRRLAGGLVPYAAAAMPGVEERAAATDAGQDSASTAGVAGGGGVGAPIWILAIGGSMIAIAAAVAWRRRHH